MKEKKLSKVDNTFLLLFGFFLHQSMMLRNVNFSISDVVVLFAIIYYYLFKSVNIPYRFIIILLGMFFIYFINGCILIPNLLGININTSSIISEISKLVALAFFYLVGHLLAKSSHTIRFLKYYSYSAVIITIFCFAATVLRIDFITHKIYIFGRRLNGFMENPNYFSTLEMTALVYFFNSKEIPRFNKLTSISILVFGILGSGSKNGFIILLVYLIYWMSIKVINNDISIDYKFIFRFTICAIIGLYIYINFFSITDLIRNMLPSISRIENMFEDFMYSVGESRSNRLNVWSNGINLIKMFPVLGVGKGNFSKVGTIFFSSSSIAHNSYIQIFAEWGLIFGSFLFIYLIYLFFSNYKRKNNETMVLLLHIFIIFMLGSIANSLNNSRMLWLTIGCLVGNSKLIKGGREVDLKQEKDLHDILKNIINNLLMIIVSAILVGGIVYGYSKFGMVNKYTANATMMIGSAPVKLNNSEDNNDINLNQIQASKALVSTYSEIVKSRGISERVINNLNLNMSFEEFASKVSIEPVNDTQIISVKVIDTIPDRAEDIANETANIFKDTIIEIMKLDNVQILDKAIKPTEPSSPNIKKNTIIGIIAGLILGIVISLIKEFTNTSISTPNDLTLYFDMPVLGLIPDKEKLK